MKKEKGGKRKKYSASELLGNVFNGIPFSFSPFILNPICYLAPWISSEITVWRFT
jgi:hypothetical protein